MYHKYYLQNTPTMMLQLLCEYNWDIRTWFSEFNVLPFVTKSITDFFSQMQTQRLSFWIL